MLNTRICTVLEPSCYDLLTAELSTLAHRNGFYSSGEVLRPVYLWTPHIVQRHRINCSVT